MELPTGIIKATDKNPKFTVIFSKPKSGKTSITAQLKDSLHIDFERGTSYVDAMKVEVNSYEDLKELMKILMEKYKANDNKPLYTYGVLDTATALEDIVMGLAIKMYQETPMGKSFKGKDITTLPNGAGYKYTREAYLTTIEYFKPFFKYLILLGHTKDKLINKEGKELSENTLDLTGKLERLICAQADALGFLYRKKNQNIINFNGGEDSVVEARPIHLRGKEIVIAESDSEGVITTYWDKIFLDK